MSFNGSKLEVLLVNGDDNIVAADGKALKKKDAMVYLGSLLAANGKMNFELAWRIGLAKAIFKELLMVWKHVNISRYRKI